MAKGSTGLTLRLPARRGSAAPAAVPRVLRSTDRGDVAGDRLLDAALHVESVVELAAPGRGDAEVREPEIDGARLLALEAADGTTVFIRADRLAEELAEGARRRGWFGRLVADDRVQVVACGDRLVLSPHHAIAGRIERRGQGIFEVDHEAAVVLRLVVDLVDRDRALDHPARMPAPEDQVAWIDGVATPRLALAIGEPGAVQAVLERIDQIGA